MLFYPPTPFFRTLEEVSGQVGVCQITHRLGHASGRAVSYEAQRGTGAGRVVGTGRKLRGRFRPSSATPPPLRPLSNPSRLPLSFATWPVYVQFSPKGAQDMFLGRVIAHVAEAAARGCGAEAAARGCGHGGGSGLRPSENSRTSYQPEAPRPPPQPVFCTRGE